MRIVVSWAFTNHHSLNRAGATDCGMSYVRGLRLLGHEVLLVEEVDGEGCRDGDWDLVPFERWHGTAHFEAICRSYDVWPRASIVERRTRTTHGVPLSDVIAFARTADLLLDVGTHVRTPEILDGPARRAFIDEAPAKTQVFHTEYGVDQSFDDYDCLFTVGLNVGSPRCVVPTADRTWHGIVHPVVMSDWPRVATPGERFTTVTNWAGKESFVLDGRYSGEKSDQWHRIIDLPGRVSVELEVALNVREGYEADRRLFTDAGWFTSDASALTTLDGYRQFIGGSRGEISAANSRYVEFDTGWTSDRSARYLACGRPVVAQSTGAEAHLPTGDGFLTFTDCAGAAAAIDLVLGDYDRHSDAAHELARDRFASERVLPQLLETACR